MRPLAKRLRELVRIHGQDERSWAPRLDALDAVEGADPDRAHEIFIEAKRGLLATRHDELLAALHRFTFLADAPRWRAAEITDREVERGIVELERSLEAARALDEARRAITEFTATATSRKVHATVAPRVEFVALASALAEAKETRRRLASEARVEAREKELRARARKLARVEIALPDLSLGAVPDAARAHAMLDALETRLAEAQALETAHAAIARELADAAVRDFTATRRRSLRARADAALDAHDVAALDALAEEARALRAEAAKLASAAARARKRGGKGPEKERRSGDPQDYFV
ncbi:MAG: hypothetical protein ACYDCK_05120 [Thermoplasmatota archaeon]